MSAALWVAQGEGGDQLPAAAICAGSGAPPTTRAISARVARGVPYWLVMAMSEAPADDAASAMASVVEVRPVELTAMTTSSGPSRRVAIIADKWSGMLMVVTPTARRRKTASAATVEDGPARRQDCVNRLVELREFDGPAECGQGVGACADGAFKH